MNLFEQIKDEKIKSVSIIGMAKNTGKTVTLNHLLKLAELSEQSAALTTIGLDGEDKDKVMDNPKPNFLLLENTIIANAKNLLLESDLNFEILAATGIESPLGEIIIARNKERGLIKLSGPSSKNDLQIIKEELDFMGPVRVRDVDEAQQRIINVIRKLEESGEIIIAGGGAGEELIE